jgi:hypothetical protein
VDEAGARQDPASFTVICAPHKTRYTVVNGRVIVDHRRLAAVALAMVVEQHNAASA